MIVNVAPSSSINSPVAFSVKRSLKIQTTPKPFVLQSKGSIFPCHLRQKITCNGGINVAVNVEMKEGEKKRGAVRIVSIVGEASVSPLKSAPWLHVMLHTVSIFQLKLLSSTPNLYTSFLPIYMPHLDFKSQSSFP